MRNPQESLEDKDLVERVRACYQDAQTATTEWRQEARELYNLVAGHQWDETDKLILAQQLRPAVTFNVSGKFLDAVSGLQITNRQEVKYLPREPGDTGVNELLTGAAEWVRDECDAEDEESEAFLDMIICGMGWCETSVSLDYDPAGEILVERRDPLELYWDPRARKRNLRDARWIMRIKHMTEQDVIDRWGQEAYDNIVGRMGFDDEVIEDLALHHADEDNKYEHDILGNEYKHTTVPVAHYEYWIRQDSVRAQTKYGAREFTNPQWRKMKKVLEENGVEYRAERSNKRIYRRAFVAGNQVLEHEDSPYQEGFTLKALTGKRDRNHNTWYGIGRTIKDPQMWTNKLFSTLLHVLATGSKGGLMAEEGAFTDPARAEEDWARPDSITWLEDGALGQGKVQEKQPAQYPAGMDKLMQFSLMALPETSGLNLEIIGMTNKVQAGVVEAQRKQSAMTIIAWAFDSMRRYYKDHGRMLAYYIREYLADGRLARISTKEGQRYIPLVKDQLTLEFDVIVDEAPTSVNVKERVWAVLESMLPQMLKMGVPIPPEVLDFSPLPADLATKWKELMNKPPSPEQQAQKQLEQQEKQVEIEETKSVTDLNRAKERKTMAEAGVAAAGGK